MSAIPLPDRTKEQEEEYQRTMSEMKEENAKLSNPGPSKPPRPPKNMGGRRKRRTQKKRSHKRKTHRRRR